MVCSRFTSMKSTLIMNRLGTEQIRALPDLQADRHLIDVDLN